MQVSALEAVNSRLKKGEGWIGYRYTKDATGIKKPSKFLYLSFYRDNQQVWVNSKTNDPEQAYRELLAARGLAEQGVVLPSDSGKMMYEHLRADYIADKPSRANDAKLNHLDTFFKKMRVTSITTDVLRSYVKYRLKSVKGPTVRREFTPLRAMFNLAANSKKISRDAVPWFPMPEDSEPAGVYITPEQFEQIRKHLPDGSKRKSNNGGPVSETNLRPFFTFMYSTGCRLGATKIITWKDVNADCTVIAIPAKNTKNKQPLKLPLAGPFLEPLAVELRKMFRRDGFPVFDSTNFRKEWAKACAKAGVGTWDVKSRKRTGVRIHDCRCSAAINLLNSGVDEGMVLKIGGWQTREMLDRYNVTSEGRLKEALTRSGKFVTDRIAASR